MIDGITRKPTTTSVNPHADGKTRPAAPSKRTEKSRPSSPSASSSKNDESILAKAAKAIGESHAVKAAKEGADNIKKASKDQPTLERQMFFGAVEAAKTHTKIAAGAALDVATAGAKVADRVTKPMRDEVVEAGSEVAEAGGSVAKTVKDSADKAARDVRDAWESQPTIERQLAHAGAQVIKNGIEGQVRTTAALFNVGKETVEGAFEIAANSPIIEGTKVAATEAFNGVRNIADAVFGFSQDVASRGADGTVKATKAAASKGSGIVDRHVSQAREDAEEIGAAVSKYRESYKDGWVPDGEKVSAAWNSQPTIERQVVAATVAALDSLNEGGKRNLANAADIVKEVGEASVQNVVNQFKDGADVVTGGVDAVKSFFGGFFD